MCSRATSRPKLRANATESCEVAAVVAVRVDAALLIEAVEAEFVSAVVDVAEALVLPEDADVEAEDDRSNNGNAPRLDMESVTHD